MPAFASYWLQANAVLLLWALLYAAVLRGLTFHRANRFFLLGGLLLAVALPLLPAAWPALRATRPQLSALLPVPLAWLTRAPRPAAPAGGWVLLAGLYAAGAASLLGRLLEQLGALYRLHQSSAPASWRGQAFRALPGAAGRAPFAFGRHIYLCPDLHSPAELAAVLAHERAHVAGAHTLDVLLAQVAVALAWLNPGAWLWQRAIRENLEFVADAQVLRAGLDRKAYQYSLLRLQPRRPGPVPATHFHFLTLKTRIQMMNQKASAPVQALRYLAAAPLALALVVAMALPTPPALAQSAPAPPAPAAPKAGAPAPALGAAKKLDPNQALLVVDGREMPPGSIGKLNPKRIESINVLKEDEALAAYGERGRQGVVLVTMKR